MGNDVQQAIILAGGKGTRMGEETLVIPKPMLKIGRMPIIWHIMKNLYHQGINEFIILGGYRIEVIHDFFERYEIYRNIETTYMHLGRVHAPLLEKWRVKVIDTGVETLTAERMLQAKRFIDWKPFILTYGDGLADIDIIKLSHQALYGDNVVTITAVHPPGRFGALDISGTNGKVTRFKEKPSDSAWINGGFFIVKPEIFSMLRNNEMFEQDSLPRIVAQGLLEAYKHDGFWQCIDTQRELEYMNKLWRDNQAPWRNWKDE